MLRLVLCAVLRMEPDGLLILAPVCSSFSDMCQAVAKRSIVTPFGDTSREFVVTGNLLAHRPEVLHYAQHVPDSGFVFALL